jgi:DNA polymerase-3 subunit delta'
VITLNAIFGQDRAVDVLRRMQATGRLPHGLLFAGPVGVGKRTTAAALATVFLCPKADDGEPCGKCEACVVMAAGNHPDFHFVYRQLIRIEKKDAVARDLSVDVIRDYLIEPAGLKPAMGQGKVFVVEEAELMNNQAQNALLKTLEEPIGRTLIVLLTDQPDALLPTIRSRTQMVRFGPLPVELVTKELVRRGIDASQAREAAALGEGSLGLAIEWHADGIVAAQRELNVLLEDALNGRGVQKFADSFKPAADAWVERQLAKDEKASKDQLTRAGLSLLLRLSARTCRLKLRDTSDDATLDSLCAAIDAFTQAESYLDANVNVSLVFQQLAVNLNRATALTV